MVKDLKHGDRFEDSLYIYEKEIVATGKNPYLKLKGKNINTDITVMFFNWDLTDLQDICNYLDVNKFAIVIGIFESTEKYKNVKCEDIQFIDEPDVNYFYKSCKKSFQSMQIELQDYISQIKDEKVRLMVSSLIGEDGAYHEAYSTMSAAKKNHHAYKHGLLEHSLEVVNLTLSMSQLNTEINHDILISSALLHDIGKIFELQEVSENVYDYTELSKLISHIAYGSNLIYHHCKMFDVATDLENQIIHCILSHHARLEHGSPVEPKTKEAWVLHNADKTSACLN